MSIRYYLLAALIVTSLISVYSAVFHDGWLGIDYATFFKAARLPIEELYRGRWLTFIYPPTGIPLLLPFRLIAFWPGFIVLAVISALAFALSVANCSSRAIASFSLLSYPALQGLAWGQLSMLMAAILIFALNLKPFRRGFLIGLLTAVKPQLFLAAPLVFAVRREWNALLGCVAGVFVVVSAVTLIYGFSPWMEWLKFTSTIRAYLHENGVIWHVITPFGFAEARGLSPLPFMLVGLFVAGWAVTRARETEDPLVLAAIIGGASILSAPYALSHDLIILMPAAMASLLHRKADVRQVSAYALSLVALPVVSLPVFLVATLRRISPHDHLTPSAERSGLPRQDRRI